MDFVVGVPSASLYCMNPHDRLRIVFAVVRPNWWEFACVMHLHENLHTKRVGVAGLRARSSGLNP
ncbi:hypothetical protein EKN81_12345 [Enterobacter asburiae]|nr:hypothetical protein EKN81_12345 [Enterobacter asburiae]RTP78291.1 hypothetical protein EKN32_12340 [Enterobacter asburiae]